VNEFDVTATSGEINFAPNSVIEEVTQNVRTIISTLKGTVPLDRTFGVDGSIIDRPIPIAQAMMRQDIVNAIRQYEPRAVIVSITFSDPSATIDGLLKPTVRIRING
jgi:phage baseplate assembly protein W